MKVSLYPENHYLSTPTYYRSTKKVSLFQPLNSLSSPFKSSSPKITQFSNKIIKPDKKCKFLIVANSFCTKRGCKSTSRKFKLDRNKFSSFSSIISSKLSKKRIKPAKSTLSKKLNLN